MIFDLDGTIVLGDGPVDAYAGGVVDEAGMAGVGEAIAAARAELSRDPGAYRDGYDAVATAARALGVTERALTAAYLASREALATAAAPVHAAPGLPAFLARLARHATLELVTNAPAVRVPEALERLGIADAFWSVTCSAGKPDGLAAVIARALERGPVLSVGDIDAFDLAPARALGAQTAHVGPAAREDGRARFAARRLEDLYDPIETWAATVAPTTGAQARA